MGPLLAFIHHSRRPRDEEDTQIIEDVLKGFKSEMERVGWGRCLIGGQIIDELYITSLARESVS